MKLSCLHTVTALLISTAVLLPASADNWPGWRGPHRNGVTNDTGVPLTWSSTDNILWQVPLTGAGISTPAVWGNRVFITASEGPDHSELRVRCLDRLTGEQLWVQQLWGTSPSLFYPRSGMASPSPVTDGQNLYAFFGTGDVFCFTMNGQLVWQRALADEYGRFQNRFAASSSPLLFGESLIVQCDHYGDSYVVALDIKTGADVWKADRSEAWHSWSSPQLVPVGAGHELIVSGSTKLAGYNPVSGKELWTVNGLAQETIPTPVFADDLIYSVSGPNGVHVAVRTGGRGDVTDTHVAWKHSRGTSFVPSAIIVDNRYYLADDKGRLRCWSIPSGRLLWRFRLNGKFTASPVVADGRLYFVSETGSTHVLDAMAEKPVELARNDLDGHVLSSPAIAHGCFYLRTAEYLYCIGRPATE